MAQSIREADAKRLLSGCEYLHPFSRQVVSVSNCTDQHNANLLATHPWLRTSSTSSGSLVVKPDVLIKRRGVSGLVKLKLSWEEVCAHLKSHLGSEVCCESLTGKLTHFIVENFYPHNEETDEMYVAMRTCREGDEILFYHKGGVSVGDVEAKAKRLTVDVREDGEMGEMNGLENLFVDVQDDQVRENLSKFIPSLYRQFCRMHFAFLEVNPFCFDKPSKTFVVLDAAAKLDHTAEFVCEELWSQAMVPTENGSGVIAVRPDGTSPMAKHATSSSVLEFPSPFGRVFTAAESYIRELDSKTGASLKLTVLNPKGRIWTMIAGGGASVVYADTLCDFGQAKELANYGEYSGAPSEVTTYEYAKTLLNLVTAEGTYREEGKILLIGGGIANFTSVADTFRGIIHALRDFQNKLLEFKVRIYVRRGGPNYQDGLKLMRILGEELGLPIKVYGPETYITAIIPLALSDDTKEKGLQGENEHLRVGWTSANGVVCNGTPRGNGERKKGKLQSSDSMVGSWHETKMEDVEGDPSFQRRVNAVMQERVEGGGNGQGVLFTKNTRCFVWGLQTRAVQEMLDFDHVCGRKKPSVAALIYEFSVSHLRSFYFGTEEIFLPICQTLKEAVEKFPDVDTLVNFASMRSAFTVTMNAMNHKEIKNIAIIAEGVPERHARQLIKKARRVGVTLIGPATVGGMKSGCFRIGNTGGSLENIMNAKLYRPGSVGFVTKSGGMLNELNNILSIVADGAYEGVAIGGDRFPGTTMMDHLSRFESDPNIKILVVLGEVGGKVEHEVAQAMKDGLLTKPVVAWCVGTCASLFSTEVSFGHAGAWAGTESEHAALKNEALRKAGAVVPRSFQELGSCVKSVYEGLIQDGTLKPFVEPEAPRVPMDYAWAKKLGLVRKPKGFVSSISDDRGEELVYAGWPISKVLQSGMGVGGVISLLWFKRPMPDYCYRYLERVLMLTGDHGPAVCGAHNTIVAARAGKDLISSLIAGLCTIGDRFGGACDQAAQQFYGAYKNELSAEEFVRSTKANNQLIMGIGHKIKSVHNPDMRVELLKRFCKTSFAATPIIDFAERVEKVTTKKKDTLILNVDGLIGVSMCDMLFGCGAFTESEAKDYIDCGCINGLFVLGRSIGFIGHYLDQKRLKQGLYRHDVDDIAYVLPDLRS
eukprot:GHVS01034947.1.p1 GENE.GHVS01034947.1~~GHVS01034947.1.p1  ORF type:complete len:1159 (+),score=157.21 GHVS01034947.1:212-3688(+)